MLRSLGMTHQVSPTWSLPLGGRSALNLVAEKVEEGTAGLRQDRRPIRELCVTWRTDKTLPSCLSRPNLVI